MLKSIADDYHCASLEAFMKVKVYYLHAADEMLHLWSVCYQKEGIFDLWREASVRLMPDQADKNEFIKFVQSLWSTKCIVEESINSLNSLKQQHIAATTELAFSEKEQQTLSDMVNPIILKLSKEDDHHGMSGLGPNYSPYYP